jgi:hypothetical protein
LRVLRSNILCVGEVDEPEEVAKLLLGGRDVRHQGLGVGAYVLEPAGDALQYLKDQALLLGKRLHRGGDHGGDVVQVVQGVL